MVSLTHSRLPFLSPVNGTISSLSLYSMASFSRYLRRPSLLKGPVAFLTVWSFWRMPAGRRAFCGGRDTLIHYVWHLIKILVNWQIFNPVNLTQYHVFKVDTVRTVCLSPLWQLKPNIVFSGHYNFCCVNTVGLISSIWQPNNYSKSWHKRIQ